MEYALISAQAVPFETFDIPEVGMTQAVERSRAFRSVGAGQRSR